MIPSCITRGAPAVVIWPNVAVLFSAVAGCPHWNQLNALKASTRTSMACVPVTLISLRQRHVEVARAHPADAVARLRRAERSSRRLPEGRRVQEPHAAVERIDRLIAVRVVEHLLRTLRARLPVQRDVGCRS